MIWFFLAGWISGAVFMVMYANRWVRKHTTIIKIKKEKEEDETHE